MRQAAVLPTAIALLVLSAISVPSLGQNQSTGTVSEPFISISAGFAHACAVAASGKAYCWGANSHGQLGDGTSEDRKTPVAVTDLESVIAIAAGRDHSCAVAASGAAYCWGDNWDGQLGTESGDSSKSPAQVAALKDIQTVAVGKQHSCAVARNGKAYCWGQNTRGQLGNGSNAASALPSAAAGQALAATITAAPLGASTCIRSTGADALCWGDNYEGQLGNGTTADSATPVGVKNIGTITVISSGREHSCAITSAAKPLCWGSNAHGQLGSGGKTGSGEKSPEPIAVSGLKELTSIAAGTFHSCGIDPAGTAYCWGQNQQGALGDGTTTSRSKPVKVQKLPAVASIATGFRFSCAIDKIGEVYCWGHGRHGQLGGGTTPEAQTIPVKVQLP